MHQSHIVAAGRGCRYGGGREGEQEAARIRHITLSTLTHTFLKARHTISSRCPGRDTTPGLAVVEIAAADDATAFTLQMRANRVLPAARRIRRSLRTDCPGTSSRGPGCGPCGGIGRPSP
ncbi:hypothetical protein GCM10023335_75290 [Streptomyces siamensis]|uniref:Uncharacterized protein n=2 Tax=Streptomyces siamensis TaxID=1274986 RepID=A0ABP9JIC7_9ACTN